MTISTLFKEYIWLVKTIHEAGGITLADLNEQWRQTEMSGVAPTVQVGRQWYAVYSAMVQREVIAGEDYDGFVCLVKEAVPKHDHMTTIDELQRMAVESFTKPVGMWNPLKAPVQGKRFKDYQAIGLRTLELLMPKG